MWTLASIIVAVVVAVALMCAGRPWWAWVIAWIPPLARWVVAGGSWGLAIAIVVWLGVALVAGVPAVRRRVVSDRIMRWLAAHGPRITDTERIALEAGTVWWDAELFSGAPRWDRIVQFAPRPLSERERAFLDGPCTDLCFLLDDQAIRAAGDLPDAVWRFIRRERFMGMIIPEEYGGLGFSANAHSAVVARLASRNAAACVTVMVPNSLGPAELLLRYGTDAQKCYYLPRLAIGDEIPCFALTEPHAGSDATALRSTGVVCEGLYRGQRVLGMRLTWDKRYITLAPVATVLGLAFRLVDPDRLLGGETELGITCALIPVDTPGVSIGQRHDPMGMAFANGPTRGRDVFVPLDQIIGGPSMIGQGWRMVVESLSAGRSLSLPADAAGGAQLATRVISAYASVREQFGLPIGRFEGVQDRLGRIAGTLYWMNAVRRVTAGAVDAGEQPAVISAIAKRWSTEALRGIASDAMDIAGGFGICRGPRNPLAPIYEGVPVGITVEGANILTRSLIVFGQGAIRCHPYALTELRAAEALDLVAFDRALAGHVGWALRNAARSFVFALGGDELLRVPVASRAAPVVRELTRLSAGFAVITDAALATLGAGLKRAENLSGRLADALAWMYIASATVNRYAADPIDDVLFVWASREAIAQVRTALRGVIDNLPGRVAAGLLRLCVFPLGARIRPPSDRLTAAAARAILDGAPARLRLTRDMFVPGNRELGLGRLEAALDLAVAARPHLDRLREAARSGALGALSGRALLDEAVARHVLSPEQRALILEAEAARDDAIQVDAYTPGAFARHHEPPGGPVEPVEPPAEAAMDRPSRAAQLRELPH
ncbi:MAG TPA: acyl-CoA dehydrogenase [Kofleriaceae bacterium]|jgi:acyl-CoA dehydrogenase|nr:acyl-CoA dehydrogenase [Kofleriaceae bacterium]